MEAVGLAASIIAIVQLGKMLNDAAASLVGQVPKSEINSTAITDRIVRDLEAMQDCLGASVETISLETGQELRDACSALELSLSGCLSKCLTSGTHFDSNIGARFKALFRGRTSTDVVLELKRIESEVSDLHRRFSMKGLMRVELAATNSLTLLEQFRSEIHQRLDFIEDHMQLRIAKAEANPGSADTLVGVSRMTGTVLKTSLQRASMDLEKSSTGLETQYLRLKVQILKDALIQFSPEPRLDDDEGSREEGGGTHHHPTDDPSQQIEDVIQQTIKLLRILRTEDQSSVPFLNTVAGLEHLSNQMLDLGMYEDARQTYCQVVRMYRASIQESSPASGLDARVARATIGLCAALQRLGEAEEALNLINEAVLVYRFLSEQSHLCYDYKAELSISLNNMANYMRDSGKALAALPVIAEAVKIREELASTTPQLYKPDLAVSLLNASTCHSKLPYLHQQALDFAESAVDISRKLVLEAPGRYTAHLGASLHNRANRRMALWHNMDAYVDIREAVGIRRTLASSRPDVYGGGLIRSLAVAKSLATLCQDEPAARAFDEELRRRCKRTPAYDNIAISSAPTISVPFKNPLKELGMGRYRIRYHGSGNLATPYIMNTANTCVDQIISPGHMEIGIRMKRKLTLGGPI